MAKYFSSPRVSSHPRDLKPARLLLPSQLRQGVGQFAGSYRPHRATIPYRSENISLLALNMSRYYQKLILFELNSMGNEDMPFKVGSHSDGLEPANTILSRKSWVTPKVITSTLKDGTDGGTGPNPDGASGSS